VPNSIPSTQRSPVNALAISGGIVYVGGYFGNIGGQSRSYIAALDASSGLATAWNPSADYYPVYALAVSVSGSTVFAAGDFTYIGGQNRTSIAKLDAGSGLATAWDAGTLYTYGDHVLALALSGRTLYVGGQFGNIGGQPRISIAALTPADEIFHNGFE
jgi:hypothetical protein